MTDKQRTAKLSELHDKHHANIVQHTKRQKLLQAAIDKIVAECPHSKETRYTDPSGGRDHAYECLICGKER